MAVRHDQPYAAWVTIQVGCNNSCAFCIVPAVRGPEASRPFGELVAELEVLAARGTVEVTLLGQNVNSYGRDLTTKWRGGAAASRGASANADGAAAGPRAGARGAAAGARAGDADLAWLAGERWVGEGASRARPLFADLLRAVGAVPGIRRVRFTSPHPKDLRPETIAAMAETPAVCEQLHLPLQSGSDRVLAAMRRGYTAERYLARLGAARAAIADLAVTTDIIVGFPGETDEDFERTLEVVVTRPSTTAPTPSSSRLRPGTRAAQMTEVFVAPEEVADRFERLKVVIDRSALARNLARIGRVEEVVVEGPSKKNPGSSRAGPARASSCTSSRPTASSSRRGPS